MRHARPSNSNGGCNCGCNLFSCITFLFVIIALGFSITSFVLVISNNNNDGVVAASIKETQAPTLEQPRQQRQKSLLAIYDDTLQKQQPNQSWTTITYAHNLTTLSLAWHHIDGELKCLVAGPYVVTLSLHTKGPLLPPNTSNAASASEAFACRPLNSWLEVRGVLQRVNVSNVTEVQASRGYVKPASGERLLEKRFVVRASVGDVLRIQFTSPCHAVFLNNFSSSNGSLASSVLLIE